MSESNVALSFPPPFRARLAHSATSATTDGHDAERRAYRAAADLLLDAADIVVSTTNSAAIGRMVTERANFDIVIFEEAAKATGPELVGALSLSGRHLLIGDDRQLPPSMRTEWRRYSLARRSCAPLLSPLLMSLAVGFAARNSPTWDQRQRTGPSLGSTSM